MEISRLWIAMLTHNRENAGTDSRVTLVINTGGIERLNHTFSDTIQDDQERAQANLYELDVTGHNIVSEELTNSSIRVGIRGDDAWRPEHIFVWGERRVFLRTEVIPLAIETSINTQLSTDEDEGPSSLPLRLVNNGGVRMDINRLFLLTTTGTTLPILNVIPGSDSPLEIQVVSNGRLVALFEIRDTFQDDLEAGSANFYAAPVFSPFTKRDLDDGSITLRIKGLDDWEPTSFFIFGLDDASGRPESLVPLVHLPNWPHGRLAPDTLTGEGSRTLALVPDPLTIDDDLVVAFNSIADGQERLVTLLEKLVEQQADAGAK
jgi:hypothetical protein